MNIQKNKKKVPENIGLALGSGSARGWSHIGVIKALKERGIKIKYIAGTSIGSVVGAALALDKMKELEEFALQLKWQQIISFLDVVFPRSGLIDGDELTDFFSKQTDQINIEDIKTPFSALATELDTGQEVVLDKGDLIDAVRASISVPGIFTPVKNNNRILVDGGLVNPVPISTLQDMGADYIIAVNLSYRLADSRIQKTRKKIKGISTNIKSNTKPERIKMLQDLNQKLKKMSAPAMTQIKKWTERDTIPNIFEVLTSTINIMESQITETRLKNNPPDILIQPEVSHIKFMDFHKAEETIAEGYKAANEVLDIHFP